jgi:hypothetical protein
MLTVGVPVVTENVRSVPSLDETVRELPTHSTADGKARRTEFRKLDIIVRDNEYVAGTVNVTTIMVRNTYPSPIRLGTVCVRHSTVVTAQENQHVESSVNVSRRTFNFRLPNFLSLLGNGDRTPMIEFGYDRKPRRSEPIFIKADQNSNVDLSALLGADRRIEVEVAAGANVRITDPEQGKREKEENGSRTEISATSEIITGFTWSTKSWLLFITSRVGIDIQVPYEVDGELRSQVASCVFEIKPPIYSIVAGGIVGSLIGSLARLFNTGQVTSDLQFLVKIFGSCLLAIMAVVALSRKSGSQAFITVEDFFGAFVLGSLIGYGGASFFEQRVLPTLGGSDHPP